MEHVYSVSQVNSYIKNMFSNDYALNSIYIKGEVSNCKYHSSGHIYFTLKDPKGQMACVMFAGQRGGLSFKLQEGQSVIAFGGVNVYERDGKYQLYAKEILLDGSGLLFQKFEELKKRLRDEGLFDSSNKKEIPDYPQKVGIVTARTGAAIQDIINIASRRNPYVQLVLYPAQVQGDGAAESIIKGIKALDGRVDTIIIGRGGGSIEDLWAFNEEAVVRAVFACHTPIISAVGHETDTTIADYAADLRAPTPSAAAELAVGDIRELLAEIYGYHQVLNQSLQRKVLYYRSRLDQLKLRLNYASPIYQIRQKRQQLMDLEVKITDAMIHKVKDKRHKLALYIEKLNGLSPANKLNQGYSFVTDAEGKTVNSVHKVENKDLLNIHVLDGTIMAIVKEKEEGGIKEWQEQKSR